MRRLSFNAKRVFLLPNVDIGITRNSVRIHSSLVDASKKRDDLFHRHTAVQISNNTGQSIIRQVIGGGGISGFTKNSIALDYDGRDALLIKGIDEQVECDLTVTKAGTYQVYRYYFSHPEVAVQIAVKMGVLGVLLGLAGVLISISSIIFN